MERGLAAVTLRLTYCQLDTGDTLELVERMTGDQLESFFQELIDRYLKVGHDPRPVASSSKCGHPYPRLSLCRYRTGQRPMAVAVYRAIRDGGQAIIQASTGIGKTMAALFPAVKTMGEGHIDRIFFLTARNTGKASALKALGLLQERGLRLKRVSLTAKDHICFCPEATCHPDVCAYATRAFRSPAGSHG
jgi:DNA excision repair protein ERCC-2